MNEKLDARWLTCHEKMFISSAVGSRLMAERRPFLERYLAAARRRVVWGAVDRHAVIGFAEELLVGLPKARCAA